MASEPLRQPGSQPGKQPDTDQELDAVIDRLFGTPVSASDMNGPAFLCFLMGESAEHQGDLEGARLHYRQAITLRPDFLDALQALEALAKRV